MSIPILKVKKIFPDAKLPVREHDTDSGADVFVYRFEKYYHILGTAYNEIIIDNIEHLNYSGVLSLYSNERVLINTGIMATVGRGYEIQVRPRSGNALKRGLTVLNTPGTIDESYRNFIGVILINLSPDIQIINLGEKIAQLVVCPVIYSPIIEYDNLDKTDRNENGFGSTGN